MATDTTYGIVRHFDDFEDDTLEVAHWTAGSTNSATAFAINTQANGVVRGTVTNNSSNDLSVLYGPVIYRASAAGPLVFEARASIITSLSQLIYIGLSDEATNERPLDYNGGSFTSTATDAVGFYYAGGEASATWRYGGVKAGSDSTQAAANAKFNPVAGTFQTFRVVVNADGAASFFINGETIKENLSNAVTASTLLNEYFSITDDGAAGSLDVDYCYISCGRV